MSRRVFAFSITTLFAVTAYCSAQQPGGEMSRTDLMKMIYQPTPVPDRVILTWNGDPATTQAVTWRTSTAVTGSIGQIAVCVPGFGFDQYKGKPDPEKVKSIEGKTELFKSDLFEANYHSVTFKDLKPKTKYVYRVGDGKTWSEWFQFRTASDQPDKLRFIYFGDAQNDVRSLWSRIVRGAYSDMPDTNFILHAGDLINRANADGEWSEWHHAAGWINGMIPSIATPGNHEYSGGLSRNWRPGFTLPENGPKGLEETVYYIDIQGVRVISLNSNEKQEEQVPWLEKVLENNPNKWTVITFHHPIYSTAKGRDNKKIRDLWRPVFDKYAPDLVLTGHDHTYGRSGLLKEDNLVAGKWVKTDVGTVYVVSVSGPKQYTLDKQEWMQSSAQGKQLYQLITIDGDMLHYEARTADGKIYDTFDLTKADKKAPAPAPPVEEKGQAVAPAENGMGTPGWAAMGVVGIACLMFAGRLFVRKCAA